jgi:hypothetical protein
VAALQRQQELLDLRLQLWDAVDDHSGHGKVSGDIILLILLDEGPESQSISERLNCEEHGVYSI